MSFKIFKVKKKKILLYENFLEEQKKAISEAAESEREINIKEEPKEKKRKEKKEKDKVNFIDLDMSIIIAVSTLKNAIGCSHIAKTLSYYIKTELNKSVCIVDFSDIVKTYDINGVPVFKKEMLSDLYDKYKYIILDSGKFSLANKKVINQAHVKIMCCVLEDSYLRELADFVEAEDVLKKWKYIFNHVPEKKVKKVDALMEDYQYWCMPVNDGISFEKEMKEAFKRLSTGRQW